LHSAASFSTFVRTAKEREDPSCVIALTNAIYGGKR
jgi:hypothetical protein